MIVIEQSNQQIETQFRLLRLQYNLRQQHMLKLLLLLLSYLLAPASSFTPRMNCYQNRVLQTIRYQNWLTYIYRFPEFKGYYIQLSELDNCGNHHGRDLQLDVSNVSNFISSGSNVSSLYQQVSLYSCRNIIVNNRSCCPPPKFLKYTTLLNEIYTKILNNTQYPILQKIFTLVTNLDANKCQYQRTVIPGLTTTGAFNQKVVDMVNQYQEVIGRLVNSERLFLNETVCLLCVGVRDFGNYFYPMVGGEEGPMKYFHNRVNQLTKLLIQLQSLHPQASSLLSTLQSSISPTSQACQSLKSPISAPRVCSDQATCQKIVLRYFGSVATPQLLYYLHRVGTDQPMITGLTSYWISETDGVGFMGNVSYASRWGNVYVPQVRVYDWKDDYSAYQG